MVDDKLHREWLKERADAKRWLESRGYGTEV